MDVYVKKYWAEDDVLFYLHFSDGEAVAQIEITSTGKVFLSSANPSENDSMLYDQSLDELDLEQDDYITKEEFDIAWNNR